ncbi:UNVERIFIED_CONTAM: hypothetical protein GTU68_052644 [Idotea baltica]|nr:hypothetical protein [Idotea baltica]
MDMFVVQGGRRLTGEVTVSGAKNAALPIMAAALSASGRCTIQSVPDLVDVKTLSRILESLAKSVADYDLVRQMRAGICVLGPLLAKRGTACVSLPGGCNIGDRPIDLHLKGLRALGEAATLMIAGAITGGDLSIQNVELSHLTAVVEKLREVGVQLDAITNGVRVRSSGRHTSTDCVALPYPGIPTDVQAQLMSLLVKADGMSVVTDKVFPDRFMHAAELVRLGSTIRREGPTAVIRGVTRLSGASVMASDLRASAALVLAALAADGESVVRRIYHLDRGYEQLEVKLNQLGACIQRLKDCPENMPLSLAPQSSKPGQLASPGGISNPTVRGPHWNLNRSKSNQLDKGRSDGTTRTN